ncbi:ABC transporter permease subunit [Pseudokineococcus marinus]|uniref:ABC transporter permease subunit n=1 Tax=Pseudokineococcus marinus TaxID=351215 RepID=A0A849BRT8_9ACTN|nr:ABC transporter permease subunit [Pseudokineococcus marinus]
MSRGRWWREVGWRHVVGLAAVAFAVFPVLYIVSAAFNPLGSVVSTDLVPRQLSLVNFQALFTDPSRPFGRWMLNTLVVCTSVTLIQVTCSAFAAYAFSRFRFRGRRGGLLALLLIQMFPQILATIALFLLFTDLGEVIPAIGLNTLAGYVLVMCGNAFAQVWLIKGFFDSIPASLDEAATVDGAGHATIFFRILLPLLVPILAVTSLLAFVGVISEFLIASIFLREAGVRTVAVGLWSVIENDRSNNLGLFAAGALLTAIPVVLLFQYLQRFIVGGITAGGVKG